MAGISGAMRGGAGAHMGQNREQRIMADKFEVIRNLIIAGKRKEAVEETKKALADGADAGEIMKDGLIRAMSIVGQKFSSGEFFLPQMMIAARAMTEVLPVLK